jgi:hypothetical protein
MGRKKHTEGEVAGQADDRGPERHLAEEGQWAKANGTAVSRSRREQGMAPLESGLHHARPAVSSQMLTTAKLIASS